MKGRVWLTVVVVCAWVAGAQESKPGAAPAAAQGVPAQSAAAQAAPAPQTRPAPPQMTAPQMTTSAATVAPDAAVISIEGMCEHPPAQAAAPAAGKPAATAPATRAGTRTRAATAAGSHPHPTEPAKPAAAKAEGPVPGPCTFVVTRAQFERLVAALNPQMAPPVRKRLADVYTSLLIAQAKVNQENLLADPTYQEMEHYYVLQAASAILSAKLNEDAKNVPHAEIEKFYNDHQNDYEEATVERLMIPRTAPPGKPEHVTTKENAENLRTRAVGGEEFDKLQKDASTAAGEEVTPPTKLNVRRSSLPADQSSLVFALQPGQVSAVIEEPAAFFLYKMDTRHTVSLAEGEAAIRNQLANKRFQDTVDAVRKEFKPTLNEAYFPTPPPPPAQPPTAPHLEGPAPAPQSPPPPPRQ